MNKRALTLIAFYSVNLTAAVWLVGGLLGWPGWVTAGIGVALSTGVGIGTSLWDWRILEDRN